MAPEFVRLGWLSFAELSSYAFTTTPGEEILCVFIMHAAFTFPPAG
jgi:hypothetical protein